MNLRFVEAFYWAAALKSVTRAAEKLFVTQSALSSRIAALESELGVLLLDRRDKQFRLTSAGQRFQRHAERLLNLQREIKAEFGGAAERPTSLRVGAIESVLHLADRLGARAAPEASGAGTGADGGNHDRAAGPDATRHGGSDHRCTAGRRRRRAHAGTAAMPMVFVGHGGSPHAAALGVCRPGAQDEFLTFQRGSQPHVALLDLCRKQGVEAPRVHNISSISAMVQLVEDGFGVATLPPRPPWRA
jgi:DNA-binding transcriptional LysR family regulator